LQTGIDLRSLRKPIGRLSLAQRESIGRFLLQVLSVAGQISPLEIDNLSKIHRLLGLDPNRLFATAHAYAPEQVSVKGKQKLPAPYLIPHPLRGTPSSDVAIDMDKVSALTSESERVSVLLQSIFVEVPQLGPSATVLRQNATCRGYKDGSCCWRQRILGLLLLLARASLQILELQFELFNLPLNLLRLAAELHSPQSGDHQTEAFEFCVTRGDLCVLLDYHVPQRGCIECVQVRQRCNGHE
jgi:hypothetical protein